MQNQDRLLYNTETSDMIFLSFHSDRSRWPGKKKLGRFFSFILTFYLSIFLCMLSLIKVHLLEILSKVFLKLK